MAVVEVRQHSSGAGGTIAPGGKGTTKRNYRTRYKVRVDDVNDAPTQIHNHFKATSSLPYIGRSFKWGNGRDTDTHCTSLEAEYVEFSEGWYWVTAIFEPASGSGDSPTDGGGGGPGRDEDGRETDDFEDEHDEIEVSYTQFSAPVYRAKYIGASRGSSPYLQKNQWQSVCNSAGVAFDPGLEEEVNIKVVRITRFLAKYNGVAYTPLIGVVNNDVFVINKPVYNFVEGVGQYQGKIHGISAVMQQQNGVFSYRLTTELHINPLGWRREVLDQGLESAIIVGLPNGEGGYYSTADIPAAGIAPLKKLVDPDGYPLGAPVPFNGQGSPKSQHEPEVWLTFATRRELPFAGFGGTLW